MPNPTISVIIPTFNRKDLLPRALDSVVRQTFHDWEIVLVDDGSTDGIESLAQSYAARLGERFRFLPQDHRGPCHARNCGIEMAQGDFLAFLDSDDEFHPTKLDRQLELFRRRPELGLVYSDYSCTDLQGLHFPSVFDSKSPAARRVSAREIAPQLFVCDDGVLDILLQQYFIATITGLVRRDVVGTRIRFLDDPAYAEEWLFYAEIVRATRVGFVNESLSQHHFMTGSVSRTSSHENTQRLIRTLGEMRRRLHPLTRSQDASLRRHLCAAHRQLGYDAHRHAAPMQAAKHLLNAIRFEPQFKRLLEFVMAAAVVPWRTFFPLTIADPRTGLGQTLEPLTSNSGERAHA